MVSFSLNLKVNLWKFENQGIFPIKINQIKSIFLKKLHKIKTPGQIGTSVILMFFTKSDKNLSYSPSYRTKFYHER